MAEIPPDICQLQDQSISVRQDNIKMNGNYIECDREDWIQLGRDKILGRAVVN